VLVSGPFTVGGVPASAKFPPWHKPSVTPLSTRGAQSGNDFNTLKNKRARLIVMEPYYTDLYRWKKQLLLASYQVAFLCVKKRKRHTVAEELVIPCGLRYCQSFLISDKGYKKILWKLRGYECIEWLKTT